MALPILYQKLPYLKNADLKGVWQGEGNSLIARPSNTISLSGNEIFANGACGIWEATTNLCTNGGFETNTTGWTASLSGAISRVTSTAKSGAACLEVTTAASTVNSGGRTNGSMSLTSGQTYSFSIWVRCASGTHDLNLLIRNAAAGDPVATFGISAVGTEWVRVSGQYTAIATENHYFGIGAQDSEAAFVFYMDDAQCENQPLATPYVETNGGTASRSNAVVNIPVVGVTPTQGWVAIRATLPYAYNSSATGYPSVSPRIWAWGDDDDNRLGIFLRGSNSSIAANREGTTTDAVVAHAHQWAAGDTLTFVFAWTATHIYLSVNGSEFGSNTQAVPPDLADTEFYLGTYISGTQHGDIEVLWFASGSGTLSDADAAYIHSKWLGGPSGFQI